MDMASKAGQISLFCDHYHAICLTHGGGHGLFIKWRQRAQIDNIDCSTMAVNDIGCGGTCLQHHCAPTDDGDTTCSLADTQAACLAQWHCIVAVGHVPVFSHLGDYVPITIFRWFRAIEASALQECYR